MAFAEKRGNLYRSRWRGPSGKLESKPGFAKRDAENYGNDQEAAIRGGTYVDPRAGQITLTEWVNRWFPAQDLEPSTLADYRNRIEVRILPAFGDSPLGSLTEESIAAWERDLVKDGYARSTARAARTLLATILSDAIPRYIQAIPAARRRGKGRKGLRRVERLERSEKVWPSPLQALLVAERCAALSGHGAEFVMMVTAAYTGMRGASCAAWPHGTCVTACSTSTGNCTSWMAGSTGAAQKTDPSAPWTCRHSSNSSSSITSGQYRRPGAPVARRAPRGATARASTCSSARVVATIGARPSRGGSYARWLTAGTRKVEGPRCPSWSTPRSPRVPR